MKKEFNLTISEELQSFRLPRYEELTDVGLYLEQATQYINNCLSPLGNISITSSMIRNYVKMGLISNPINKQYYANHIAYLIAIALLKNVLSLENIMLLIEQQKQTYSTKTAYDYLCMELENLLQLQFKIKDKYDTIGVTSSFEKEMLRSAITSVSHIIYLDYCFSYIKDKTEI